MHQPPEPSEEKIVSSHANGVGEMLAREAPEVLEKLPPEEKEKLVRVVREVATFQGPIPPPSIIEGYERVLPGSGQTIIEEFKKEGEHRRDIEKALAKHSMSISRRAQLYALLLGMTGLGGGIYLCATGNNVGGLGMVGVSLATLVTAFLKALSNEKEAAKSEIPPPAPEVITPAARPKPKNKKRR
jgi:uncharacterized membrane protein